MTTDALSATTRLVSEFGYPEPAAALVAEGVRHLSELVADAFQRWWSTAAPPDATVQMDGYTEERLMAQYGMNRIVAFLTLDALLSEPDMTRTVLVHGRQVVRFAPSPPTP